MKNIEVMKKIIIIFCIILLIPILMFCNYLFGDEDFCLDTNICPKDYEINTEHGLVKLNKENCTKYGWKWLEKAQMCNMRN